MFSISVTQKLCKFFWLKIPEWLRPPKECLPNYKYRHCFLESVALFIHSLSHKVKQLIMHIFVGITKHFQDFFVRGFCKWSLSVEFSYEDSAEACKTFWEQQTVFYKWCMEVGKEWTGLTWSAGLPSIACHTLSMWQVQSCSLKKAPKWNAGISVTSLATASLCDWVHVCTVEIKPSALLPSQRSASSTGTEHVLYHFVFMFLSVGRTHLERIKQTL